MAVVDDMNINSKIGLREPIEERIWLCFTSAESGLTARLHAFGGCATGVVTNMGRAFAGPRTRLCNRGQVTSMGQKGHVYGTELNRDL